MEGGRKRQDRLHQHEGLTRRLPPNQTDWEFFEYLKRRGALITGRVVKRLRKTASIDTQWFDFARIGDLAFDYTDGILGYAFSMRDQAFAS